MWTPPTGQSIIDTEVQYRASGASWPDIAYVGLTTPEIQQPDTIVGSTFQARARARAAAGASPWSATGSFVGTLGCPACTLPVTMSPDSILVYDLSGNRQTGRNSPSLPRARTDWRLQQPACTSPVTAGSILVYGGASARDSILVYVSGNRQTGDSPSLPRTRKDWRLQQPACTLPMPTVPDSILVYDLSGNRQTGEEFTVATTSRQADWRLQQPACTLPAATSLAPDSILVYDLSGNRQTGEEFTVATTSRTDWRLQQPACTLPTWLRLVRRIASWCTTCPAIAKRGNFQQPPSLPSDPLDWRYGSSNRHQI